jgi:chaperonin GroEL (HSP60 family)
LRHEILLLPLSIHPSTSALFTHPILDVGDMMAAFVWEPATMKVNLLGAATEAATLILSIDETIKAAPPPKQQ